MTSTTSITTLIASPTPNATANGTLGNSFENSGYVKDEEYLLIKKILFSIIFIFSVIGNGLIMSSIIFIKRLRRMKSNYLIFHLGLCDLTMNFFSIPTNLIMIQGGPEGGYPFDAVGCKTLWPIATYAINASAMTLVCIAVERYLAINSLLMRYEKRIVFLLIFLVQLISIGSVIPYILTLKYLEFTEDFAICYEEWHLSKEQKAYTIVLFLLQYGIPFVTIVLLYGMAWWIIMQKNRRMIKVSEEYERKIANNVTSGSNSEQSSSVSVGSEARECPPPSYEEVVQGNLGRRLSQGLKKRVGVFKKPRYISHTAYVRHRQTMRTLEMFTIVVVVFAVMALPNQILWLIADFKPERKMPTALVEVATFITYTNAVINCWIYGGYNKHFRRAYKEIFLTIFPCFKRYCQTYQFSYDNATLTRSRMTSIVPETPRDNNNEHESEFNKRQRVFTEMFNDHLNNYEKYQHLYERDDKICEEDIATIKSPQQKSPKPGRKMALSNLITTISSVTSSRKTSEINSPTFNIPPPIIPFLPNKPTPTKRRASTSALDLGAIKDRKKRTATAVDVDLIDINNLVPIEVLKDRKKNKHISNARKTSRPTVFSAPTTPCVTRKSFLDILSPMARKKSNNQKLGEPMEHDELTKASEIKIQNVHTGRNVQIKTDDDQPSKNLSSNFTHNPKEYDHPVMYRNMSISNVGHEGISEDIPLISPLEPTPNRPYFRSNGNISTETDDNMYSTTLHITRLGRKY